MSEESRHIIESGELEVYLLGALDAERSAVIEALIATDDDIAREVAEIRRSLDTLTQGYALHPPPQLRESILGAAFTADSGRDSRLLEKSLPQQKIQNAAPNTVQFSPASSAHTRYLRYAVAASVLFVISTSSAFYFWNKTKRLGGELDEAQGRIALLENNGKLMASKVSMYNKYVAMMYDNDVAKISMNANAASALIKASPAVPMETHSMVMWDKKTNTIYVDPHSMPQNQPDTDYQLWALVKGQPVDLGTFNTAEQMPMASMKTIAEADAFAVTLEPKGGSKVPTLGKLCVLGKATS